MFGTTPSYSLNYYEFLVSGLLAGRETGSSKRGTPTIADLEKIRSKEEYYFYAVLDTFGLSRYFKFENDDDIEKFVHTCYEGHAMFVQWMALKKSVAEQIEIESLEIKNDFND